MGGAVHIYYTIVKVLQIVQQYTQKSKIEFKKCNSQYNNNNNVVFSIYHAEIVSRVENIVHSPIGSCTMIHPGHYFGIVNAKHNIII